MNGQQTSEAFIQKETENENSQHRIDATTESDAVHPRFQVPKKKEVIEAWQTEHDYHCEQCNLFFAPTILGLNTHFKEDMVKHKPVSSCFYCKGPVYGYSFNKKEQIYHYCTPPR